MATVLDRAARLHRAGRLDQAEQLYRQVLRISPDQPDAHHLLGVIARQRGRTAESVELIRRALALDPTQPVFLANLAQVLRERGELTEALAASQRAVELSPILAAAHNGLGNALLGLGRSAEAVAAFRRAVELQPDYAEAADNLLLSQLYLPDLDPADLLAEHRAWGARTTLATPGAPHPNSPDPQRRLRIGYVSPDFRQHAIAYAFLPLLANHDRRCFEIFCYSNTRRTDAVTEQLRGLADAWRDILDLDDAAAAAQVRADRIDLLIDLACHTGGNRLGLFAQRPAPLQITHSVMTSGLPAMDYLLSDERLAPDLQEGDLVERLLRLPRCFTAYAPPDDAPPVGPLPALASGCFTFGSFNNLAKLTPRVIALWSQLLRDLPDSRLLLKGSQPVDQLTHQRFRALFAEQGVDPGRVELLDATPSMADHLALYNQVDLGLDPFPFNGCTTTCEALWMGVPVITLAGRLFADRAGLTLLQAVGLPGLVVTDQQQYLAQARRLASDLPLLAELRAGLRERVQASELCDGWGYARAVERALRQAWVDWCASKTGADLASAEPSDSAPAAPWDDLAKAQSLHQQGQLEAAEAIYQRVLNRWPDQPDALHLLGVLAHQRGDRPAAVELIERAIAGRADVAAYHSNLGNLYQELGRSEQAIVSLRQAVELQPDFAAAWMNLGNALHSAGRAPEAVESYQRSLALDAVSAETYNNLGNALLDQNQVLEAIAACERALLLHPDYAEAHCNLANALKTQGRLAEATSHYRRAVELKPDLARAADNLLLHILYDGDLPPAEVLAEHHRWGQRVGQRAPAIRPHDNPPDPSRRLRIGYVSPDFRYHPIAFAVLPLLEHHDRQRFEIFCYSNHVRQDAMTDRLRSLADGWRPVIGLEDEAVAEQIRADGIDLLVDLACHTGGNRLGIFALKPAPVQLSHSVMTTGLPAIDYLISDHQLAPNLPPDAIVEQLLRLPGCYTAFAPPADAPPVGPPPSLASGQITFGSFNNLTKLTPQVVVLWSELLAAVPNSRLLLKAGASGDGATVARFRALFAEHGLTDDRLTILPPLPNPLDHLATYGQLDVALDPFPFNGFTTTLEALWMGVPVITLAGQIFADRGGVTILHSIGHPELIAATPRDYVRLAADLAQDHPRLTTLRAHLRQDLATSPICDAPTYTHHLETAYRQIWQHWCDQQTSLPNSPAPSPKPPAPPSLRGKGAGGLGQPRRRPPLRPNPPSPNINTALHHHQSGRLDQAADAYRAILAANPRHPVALHLLGVVALQRGQASQAIDLIKRAIAIDASVPEFHSNLGNAYQTAGQFGPASAAFRQALARRENYPDARFNLGNALRESGQTDEALASYRRALELDPNFTVARDNLLLTLLYQPDLPPADLLAEYRRWGSRTLTSPAERPPIADPNPDRRLRLGYVSADLREHPMAFAILPLLANHDRQRFEVFAYSCDPRADAVTARLRGLVDHWRDATSLSDDGLTAQIRADRIDVLIDLSCHTGGNRLGVFARRAAPLQLTHSVLTSGLPEMDVLISDHQLAPNLPAAAIVERLLRLPRCYTAFEPPAAAPPVSPLPALQNNHITFGCFNNPAKLNDQVVALWSALLQQVPNSRLLLKGSQLSDPAIRECFLVRFAQHGLPPDRFELLGATPTLAEHLALYARVDLALDPFPFNGFTTTLEALWMGVPVVTLAGQLFADRGGVTLLTAAGLPDLVAATPAAYLDLATHLTTDLPALANLRARLRPQLAQSELCDGPGYAHAFESAIRNLWREACSAAHAPSVSSVPSAPAPPGLAEALQSGLAAHQSGQLDLASADYQRALALDPDQPDALHLLGVLALQTGDPARAVDLIGRAVARRPDLALFHSNLGNALLAQDLLDRAIASYQQALQLQPDLAETQANLSEALRRRGDASGALAAAQRAVALRPDFAPAQAALGAAQLALGQPAAAASSWRTALALAPDDAESANNLGNALRDQGQLQAAIASYRQALQLRPSFPAALNNLANALLVAGEHAEALACWRAALAAAPDFTPARDNLLFGLLYVDGLAPTDLLAEYRRWADLPNQPQLPAPDPARLDPNRRLRLGYLSPDFADHPMARHLLPLLANHDRSQVEIYCYASGSRRDAWTDRFRALADGWCETTGLSDDALAARLQADQVDILIDLACHTEGNRLAVFARRPAPLQLTHSVMTSGLAAIDYLVSDHHLAPDLPEDLLAERLLRLPGCYTVWTPPDQAPRVGPLPALTNGHVTFGSFNNLAKLTDRTIALWTRLLGAVPGSRLLLKSSVALDAPTADHYRQRFTQLGLAPERIVLLARTESATDHLDLYNQVDLCLDTFPFNGFSTTCEALWMGVPVVTLAGQLLADRGGVSLLNAVNLPELIAPDPDDYLRRAQSLVADLPALAALRSALREHVRRSPLCDGPAYARDFESALRNLWREACAAHLTPSVPVVPTVPPPPSLTQALESGLAAHQSGQLDQAAALYHQALELAPDQPDALHLLGVIALQTNQPEQAIELIERAIAVRPEVPTFHSNLGNAHLALGETEPATAAYQRALALAPDYADAWSNLGQAQRLLGQLEAAAASCRRALELRPDYPQAANNLGAALQAAGQLEQAAAAYQRALSLAPDYAEALANLGNLQREQGQFEAAVVSLQRALELSPSLGAAYNNLGNALADLGRADQAEVAFRRALELDPADADAYNNLCCLLHQRGDLSAALAAGQCALELRPDHAQALNNLGNALKDSGDLPAAERCYRRALELLPDFVAAHDNLLFALLFKEDLAPAELLAGHRRWDELHGQPLARFRQPHTNQPDPNRRLRVGYVSADFRNHPIAYAVLPLLAAHDHQQFEITCYASGWKQDATTAQLRGLVDRWRDVAGLSDAELADLIRQDGIDLLVDLSCHTAGNRLRTFARKPAPIQLTHSVMTSGLAAIDYLVTDHHLGPDLPTDSLAEQPLRLPDCYTAYAPPALDLPVGPLPALTNGYVTFGSFNNLAKVGPSVVDLWSRVLTALPGSRLLLKGSNAVDPVSCQRWLDRFAAHGLTADRVEILDKTATMADHLALYDRVDLALDPFPFNGFSTSCEALWMGVPFVTLAGRLFADRAGVTFLRALALPELIAVDADDYLTRTTLLASDLPGLAALRGQLRQRLLRSPLCDASGYARDLETAYRQIWARWCAQQGVTR